MTARATLYDAAGKDREMELRAGIEEALSERTLLWADLDKDARGFDAAEEVLGLPSEVLARIREQQSIASMDAFPKMVWLRVPTVRSAAVAETPQGSRRAPIPSLDVTFVDIVAAPNLVVTFRDGPVEAFDNFRGTMHGETTLGALEAAAFMAALIDSILTVYLSVCEEIERAIDTLDELALRSRDPEAFLAQVVTLRRRVATLRRALAPLRVAIAPLARPDMEIAELGKPWPGLLDRLERTIDTVENARELLLGSFDVFMARNAERANDIMKSLTILNAVLLPAVVIAGMLGMNFALPFFEDIDNFWYVILGVTALSTATLAFSRRQGWI